MEQFSRGRWTTIPAPSASYTVCEVKYYLFQLFLHYFLWLVQTCVIRCVKRIRIEIFLIRCILHTLLKRASPLRFTWLVWMGLNLGENLYFPTQCGRMIFFVPSFAPRRNRYEPLLYEFCCRFDDHTTWSPYHGSLIGSWLDLVSFYSSA